MLNLLIPVIGTLLDKVLPDPKMAAEAKFKIIELAQKGELANLESDVKLAIAQICGLGLGIQFIISPLFTWVSLLLGYNVIFPILDSDVLMTLLFGMLGLGTLRTTEKLKCIK